MINNLSIKIVKMAAHMVTAAQSSFFIPSLIFSTYCPLASGTGSTGVSGLEPT